MYVEATAFSCRDSLLPTTKQIDLIPTLWVLMLLWTLQDKKIY